MSITNLQSFISIQEVGLYKLLLSLLILKLFITNFSTYLNFNNFKYNQPTKLKFKIYIQYKNMYKRLKIQLQIYNKVGSFVQNIDPNVLLNNNVIKNKHLLLNKIIFVYLRNERVKINTIFTYFYILNLLINKNSLLFEKFDDIQMTLYPLNVNF